MELYLVKESVLHWPGMARTQSHRQRDMHLDFRQHQYCLLVYTKLLFQDAARDMGKLVRKRGDSEMQHF